MSHSAERQQTLALVAELDTKDAIREALRGYEDQAGNDFRFQISRAAELKATPEKPNTARSETDAFFRGHKVGKLFTIAFSHQDGTGAPVEGSRELENLYVYPPYPSDDRVIPRDKVGVFNEVHLNLITMRSDGKVRPTLYAGRYDLLGLGSKDTPPNVHEDLGRVLKIGELGHPEGTRRRGANRMDPVATYTVGYREGPDGQQERFGDPHAVFSSMPDYMQVCAFLAVSDEMAQALGKEVGASSLDILQHFDAQEPRWVNPA
jgi:hypothetical protein